MRQEMVHGLLTALTSTLDLARLQLTSASMGLHGSLCLITYFRHLGCLQVQVICWVLSHLNGCCAGVCLVCLDASRDWQMVPCGHAAACKTCAQQLQQHELPCPVCRAPVTGLCYRQFQQTFVGSAASSNDCKHQRQQAF